MRLRVGVVGLGRSGMELHCDPLSKMEDQYELVAVCDQSEKRLEIARQSFGVKTFTNYADLLSEPGIDLVVICTPPNYHSSMAIQAMEAGKHVVVEKPMCLGVDEADKMIKCAKDRGVILTVFQNRRWDPDFETVKQAIQSGLIGDLFVIEARVMSYGEEWTKYGVAEFRPSWRLEKKYGGGQLLDWGAHLIDHTLQIVQSRVIDVYCDLQSRLWTEEVDDHFKCMIRFENGVIAHVESSNNARLVLPRWYAIGSKGTLYGNGEWGRWEDITIRTKVGYMDVTLKPSPKIAATSGVKALDVNISNALRFYGNIREVIEGKAELAIKPEEARQTISVIEAARKSSEMSQVVNLKS
ncbi:MAG: Gfo/Idh/MocA family oxidoreductase [Firmicutes bacterium]|nr:Gfo/Idh/MocA family oxidoreductase [Bacillota bacterium]